MWSVFVWPGVKLNPKARHIEGHLDEEEPKENFMDTQLDYRLIMMHHRQLLAEAEHDRQIRQLPRRLSRLKLLWAAIRQRMGTRGDKNWATSPHSLQEKSA